MSSHNLKHFVPIFVQQFNSYLNLPTVEEVMEGAGQAVG